MAGMRVAETTSKSFGSGSATSVWLEVVSAISNLAGVGVAESHSWFLPKGQTKKKKENHLKGHVSGSITPKLTTTISS
jgi:hypothetical protein